MSIEIQASDTGGVYLIGSGEVSGEDLYEANSKIYRSPALIKKYNYQLMNFLEVDSLNVSYDMIEKLTAQDQKAYEINPDIKMVCVTDKENIFNLMKMWESFVTVESFQTKVVKTIEEANNWLGLKE